MRLEAARRARALPVLRRYPTAYVVSGVDGFRKRRDFDRVRAFVIFVGQPRTGHSLVGALLDAHQKALIAHELDVLKYVAAGYDRRRLYSLLVRAEQQRVAAGHVSSTGYRYAVDGQWQGRYDGLEVIGDKKGGRSTMRLGDDITLLDRLRDTVGVDVHVVQVVRNPYDTIATMRRRAPKRPLSDVVELFFALADTARVVRDRVGEDRFHVLHHETLIAEPRAALVGLCRFVGLTADPAYLDACCAIVRTAAHRSRDGVGWTNEVLDRVAWRAAADASLAHYCFDDPVGEPS
jgi:hypothetical protein